MDLKHPYLIKDLNGFTPHISHLICMMNYARWTTLQAVEGLSSAELDARPNNISNSVGMLLEHMAAVETVYQYYTFKERNLTEEERTPWKPGLTLGELGQEKIKNQSLEYFLERLSNIREKTLEEFGKRDDSWLAKETPFGEEHIANNYFKWFHVFEDELNHRGQIRPHSEDAQQLNIRILRIES